MIDPSMATPQVANDQFLRWPTPQPVNTPNFNDPSLPFSPSSYAPLNQSSTMQPQIPQNQLALRTPQNQLVPRGKAFPNDGTWSSPGHEWDQSLEELQQRALVAKREAQAKRKSIPPFVQKLSSFLDKSENTDLIRWSDSGDSFIVVDEDEFARTLIPELFKHNNYASFVRQLNMYGFHKKVGLSDNSMRASEKKSKAPSEYSNPYFKRGHPELLWLIQKPKNPLGAKKGNARSRATEEIEEEQADELFDNDSPASQLAGEQAGRDGRRPLLLSASGGQIVQAQFASIHRELQAIRQQQQVISNAIARLRKEHDQLYNQAAAFQTLHDKHQNSINAILTFLATIYHKSLEGGHSDNVAGMFGSLSPDDHTHQGIDDFHRFQEVGSEGSQITNLFKKQPLLIKAAPPSTANEVPTSRANTMSPAATPPGYSDVAPERRSSPNAFTSPTVARQAVNVTPTIPTTKETPTKPAAPAYNQTPEQDIMSMIQHTNSENAAGPQDFNQALTSLETADGSQPLTQNQRQNMLKLMAHETAPPGTKPKDYFSSLTATSPSPSVNLVERMSQTKVDLDNLAAMQKAQNAKVHNIVTILQPLTPNGTIPGFTGEGPYFPSTTAPTAVSMDAITSPVASTSLDIDQFFNSNDYYSDPIAPPDYAFSANQAIDAMASNMGYNSLGNDASNNNMLGDELFGTTPGNDGINPRITEANSNTTSSGASPVTVTDNGLGLSCEPRLEDVQMRENGEF